MKKLAKPAPTPGAEKPVRKPYQKPEIQDCRKVKRVRAYF